MTDRPQYGGCTRLPKSSAGLRGCRGCCAPDPVIATPAVVEAPAAPKKPAGRPWDRILTIALLAYGVVNVFMTGMSYLNLPDLMNESMKILGIEGEFTNFEQARVWGTVAAIVLVIGWVLTAWLSMRRLRSGKITWWLPLVRRRSDHAGGGVHHGADDGRSGVPDLRRGDVEGVELASVLAVCAVHELRPDAGTVGTTAIRTTFRLRGRCASARTGSMPMCKLTARTTVAWTKPCTRTRRRMRRNRNASSAARFRRGGSARICAYRGSISVSHSWASSGRSAPPSLR